VPEPGHDWCEQRELVLALVRDEDAQVLSICFPGPPVDY
jgi:hypothetical protein